MLPRKIKSSPGWKSETGYAPVKQTGAYPVSDSRLGLDFSFI